MKLNLLFVCLAVGGIVVETIGIRQKRSIGGQPISIEQAPFFVSIRRLDIEEDAWIHVCGGALITMQHVLTAAHCIFYKNRMMYPEIIVVSGTARADRGDNVREIDTVFRPSGFKIGSAADNIAILRLSRMIEENNEQSPIELSLAEPVHNELAALISFQTIPNRPDLAVLNQLEVTIHTAVFDLPDSLSDYVFRGVVEDGQSMSNRLEQVIV